jgi:hypothetical protein
VFWGASGFNALLDEPFENRVIENASLREECLAGGASTGLTAPVIEAILMRDEISRNQAADFLLKGSRGSRRKKAGYLGEPEDPVTGLRFLLTPVAVRRRAAPRFRSLRHPRRKGADHGQTLVATIGAKNQGQQHVSFHEGDQ